ncbi:uncharacterized protein [Musca autumnalis]|uniref:uncharacterized protein n=1 Tax=Musca autumnalis TaxID=221902 RepID=UPI003CE9A91C
MLTETPGLSLPRLRASYKRGDKISEHFKQLDLAPEEIDPDVAPLDSENEVIFDSEVVDQAEEEEEAAVAAAAAITENTPVEEAAQSVATTAAPAVTTAPVTAAATEAPVKGEEENSNVLAKYCKCSGNHCDCCRNFNLPIIPIKGPGCARMSYLGNEKMAVSLKYGDLTLITRTVSSRRARPICVGLPGGYSQFCGRIYGLSKASENFKACLGFELRADDEVEAALRVSCFKFGSDGLKVTEAEPLPSEAVKQEEDDDDDIFGFGAGDDDEDDYDDDTEDAEDEEADDDEDTDADYADDDDTEAPADADYGGFSLAGLLDELADDDDEDEVKPVAPATAAPVDATRTADAAQSKDEKGTEAAAAPATEMMDEAAAAATLADTLAPATESTTATKTKKAKKSKKNKKKKAADTEGGDFAYELLNGLLDFFN